MNRHKHEKKKEDVEDKKKKKDKIKKLKQLEFRIKAIKSPDTYVEIRDILLQDPSMKGNQGQELKTQNKNGTFICINDINLKSIKKLEKCLNRAEKIKKDSQIFMYPLTERKTESSETTDDHSMRRVNAKQRKIIQQAKLRALTTEKSSKYNFNLHDLDENQKK